MRKRRRRNASRKQIKLSRSLTVHPGAVFTCLQPFRRRYLRRQWSAPLLQHQSPVSRAMSSSWVSTTATQRRPPFIDTDPDLPPQLAMSTLIGLARCISTVLAGVREIQCHLLFSQLMSPPGPPEDGTSRLQLCGACGTPTLLPSLGTCRLLVLSRGRQGPVPTLRVQRLPRSLT